jgi:DNA-binding transcriptional ArsR family regulator
MQTVAPPRPTLWRTCRVLANRPRLKIIAVLIARPWLTVEAVAEAASLQAATASQYLRALEARGILQARRQGRHVRYRLAVKPPLIGAVVAALARTFKYQSKPAETVFRLATAFTHPRRIEIYHAIFGAPKTLLQIRAATRIPLWALQRHIRKLENRDFVAVQAGHYVAVCCRDALGHALSEHAAG